MKSTVNVKKGKTQVIPFFTFAFFPMVHSPLSVATPFTLRVRVGWAFRAKKSGVECCSNEGNSVSLRRQILMTNIFNMKKRITLLFAAALSMSTLAFAQPEPGTFSITPRIGLSMTNLLDDNAQGLSFAYLQPFSGSNWGNELSL
jgi:hypothetical protein